MRRKRRRREGGREEERHRQEREENKEDRAEVGRFLYHAMCGPKGIKVRMANSEGTSAWRAWRVARVWQD